MSAAAGTATGAATASDAPRVPGGAASAAAPPGQAGGPVLHAAGLERLEPTGEPFDPAEQHAVEQLPRQAAVTPVEDGQEQVGHAPSVVVHGVLRPGYRWRGRLMRPAMVRVHSE